MALLSHWFSSSKVCFQCFVPLNPGGHWHWNPTSKAKHVAPFKQGCEKQSFTSNLGSDLKIWQQNVIPYLRSKKYFHGPYRWADHLSNLAIVLWTLNTSSLARKRLKVPLRAWKARAQTRFWNFSESAQIWNSSITQFHEREQNPRASFGSIATG